MQPKGGVYTVELVGPPGSIAMPPLCANCGSPPAGSIRIEKMLETSGNDGKASRVFFEATPPFCTACLVIHSREVRVVPALQRVLFLFRSFLLIPAVGGLAGMFFFLKLALHELVSGAGSTTLFLLLPVGVFGLIAVLSLFAAFRDTRRHAFIPSTSITSAFHFTGDLSTTFEPERHSYVLRNREFATAFVAANSGRTWSLQDRAHASFKRRILKILGMIGAGALVVWALYEEYFR